MKFSNAFFFFAMKRIKLILIRFNQVRASDKKIQTKTHCLQNPKAKKVVFQTFLESFLLFQFSSSPRDLTTSINFFFLLLIPPPCLQESSNKSEVSEPAPQTTSPEPWRCGWPAFSFRLITNTLSPAVSELNKLDSTESGGNGTSLTIVDAETVLSDVHLGDSIAVNGVCLTVTEFSGTSWFKVGIAPETLRRTNLGDLTVGSPVNLERAVAGHVRFGGHFVQGHVDTVAEIVSKVPDGNAVTFTFKLRDPEYMAYIVEKGFISVDGASLTITAVDDDAATFSVMLIAYTQGKVVTAKKEVGDLINVEVDLMGKLVEKQVKFQIKKELEKQGISK